MLLDCLNKTNLALFLALPVWKIMGQWNDTIRRVLNVTSIDLRRF
jgi:hypothetical protein